MSGCDLGPPVAGGDAGEEAIRAMVRRFYALGFEDELLGPMFRAIPEFETHLGIVADFWSHTLLGTARYDRGTPFAHHLKLKVEEEHFERWMKAFEQAVAECLPAELRGTALQRARHMTMSFKAGMLPLPRPRLRSENSPSSGGAG